MESKKRLEPAWWKEAVFYIVYPRSFKDSDGDGNGDIRGIIEKIDHIKNLGAKAVWIAPLYASPMVDNGYDISDYDDINPLFGTMADFDELVGKMHAAGLKLMMDLVVNHTSEQHPWFKESRSSRDNPKRDWYIWKDPKDGAEPNNWASSFGGSAWTLDEATGQYYLHLFAREQPDLNWRNPEVKREVFAMMRRWLARGVDSFRMDMASVLLKPEDFLDAERQEGDTGIYVKGDAVFSHHPGLLELYEEMRRDVLEPHKAVLFAEMHMLTPEIALRYVAFENNRFHLAYQNHIVHAYGDWTKARHAVREWHGAFKSKGWTTTTFGNHDSPRPVSMYGDTSSEAERKASAKLIAAFHLTAPGTPFIYQGEEIGMTNVVFDDISDYNDLDTKGHYEELVAKGEDPKIALALLARLSRDNARTPMQWDASPNAGFTAGKPWLKVNSNFTAVNAVADEEDPDSVLHFYRALITLRSRAEALVYGDYVQLSKDGDDVSIAKRSFGDEEFLIVLNCSPREGRVDLDTLLAGGGELALANLSGEPDAGTLRPWEARIYGIRKKK